MIYLPGFEKNGLRLIRRFPVKEYHCGEWMCYCGKIFFAAISNIVTEKNKSCGCYRKTGAYKFKHWHGKRGQSRTYKTWLMMRARCENPKNNRFYRYGARGIGVCERWLSFTNFLEDMGERPEKTSIDRVDVDGNYEPSNCRWADAKTQAREKKKGG